MNPWPFVIAAYAATIAGTALLLVVSLIAMRRAEAASERIGSGREG
jgi:hypothetical protein